jgi:N-acetylneuraminic acid mutarotase
MPTRASTETTENTWTSKASLPDGVSIVKAAVVNGKIFAMTGSSNYEYDPAADNWTAKSPMPTPRTPTFGIAVYQNKIYVMGGQDSTLYTRGYYFLSTNEVYDPLTDTWETKAPMPTSREGVEANVVNGKIYVIGGKTYASDDSHHSNDTNVNEVYDTATDAWSTKQPAPIAVERYASTVVDDKIYIMGGTSDQINDNSLQWVSNQIYDVENDTWSLGASLPNYTYNAAAGATTGLMAPRKIYVMGGGFTTTSNTVLVYDLTLDNWSFGAPMSINRSCLAVAVVNDIIYAIGGTLNYQGTFPVGDFPLTNVVEQYIPFGYGTIPPVVTREPEPFPTTLVITTSGASAAIIGISLLVYFKKRKH